MPTTVPTIIELASIQRYLETIDLIPLIEHGFIAYSSGQAVIPPVGELLFDNPPGETHIGRVDDDQLTVADLTGVAVQDIMIASAIFNHHK